MEVRSLGGLPQGAALTCDLNVKCPLKLMFLDTWPREGVPLGKIATLLTKKLNFAGHRRSNFLLTLSFLTVNTVSPSS